MEVRPGQTPAHSRSLIPNTTTRDTITEIARNRSAGVPCGRQCCVVNTVRPQLEELLFSSLGNVLVESVEVTDMIVRVGALSTARQATCPGCEGPSGRLHGSYLRFPHDLPTAGELVVVALRVRRFVCAEASCPRRTFAEQVPGLTRRFGRRTERLRSTLISVGLTLAGRAGAPDAPRARRRSPAARGSGRTSVPVLPPGQISAPCRRGPPPDRCCGPPPAASTRFWSRAAGWSPGR
ncbi:transposase family protein [Streptomyces sp. NPDC059786]|uniref:transposase family protein n=1 Tax=Streptomyces sp. NPDC059786 TaxID=3346946 RepID=UPI003647B70A